MTANVLRKIILTTMITLEKIDARFDAMDRRFTKLEAAIFRMNERMETKFDAIDERFDSMDRRFDAIDTRFEIVDQRFEVMEKRFDQGFETFGAKMEAMMDEKIEELTGMVARGFTEVRSDINRLEDHIETVCAELTPRVDKLEELAIKF